MSHRLKCWLQHCLCQENSASAYWLVPFRPTGSFAFVTKSKGVIPAQFAAVRAARSRGRPREMRGRPGCPGRRGAARRCERSWISTEGSVEVILGSPHGLAQVYGA